MGNIVVLDDLTINKIAAGEVIERPASVVKEMMENSIDAKADKIEVEIKNGGISYIRITDNGNGIAPDDMEYAFERHATSKIRVADDLENIKSMGFRGEALASIAAISHIEMISRTLDSNVGYKIVLEGGKVLERGEVGCPVGTTITVTDLFFNTPVRYKFLKKDFTEAGYIEDAVTRLALANTNISVKLVNMGKTVVQTSGNGILQDAIYSIYGKEISEAVVPVNFEYEGIKIEGVVGKPEIGRSNRTNQIFFVNRRYVKNVTLSSAVEQAYKGLLPIGRFAFIVVNMEIEPNKIDINVHPAKLEIKFQEEQKVFKALYSAIKQSLLNEELVKNTSKEPDAKEIGDTIKLPTTNIEENKVENEVVEEKSRVPSFINLFKRKKEEIEIEEPNNIIGELYKNKEQQNSFDTEKFDKDRTAQIKTPTEEQVDAMTEILNKKREMTEMIEHSIPEDTLIKNESEFDEMYVRTFGKLPSTAVSEKETVEKIEPTGLTFESGKNLSVFEDKEAYNKIPNYKFIGIAFSTYIILELENEMYILDQHAAHERVNYEKIKKNFYSQMKKDSQLMLLPDVITLTHKEMDIVRENVDMFEKAGFTLEEFGDNTIKLTGVPNICMDLDTKQLFLDILDEIDTVALTARQEKEDKFIATIACKASVKAKMALTKDEVDSLMEKLLVLPNPFTCPHGRPTAIKMTKYDIERKFNRK